MKKKSHNVYSAGIEDFEENHPEPGQSVLLAMLSEERLQERARAKSYEERSGVFIAAIAALLVISAQSFDYQRIISALVTTSTVQAYVLALFEVLLVAAQLFLSIVSIICFAKILSKSNTCSFINMNDIEEINRMKSAKAEYEQYVVDYYIRIIRNNNNINENLKQNYATAVHCFEIYCVVCILSTVFYTLI